VGRLSPAQLAKLQAALDGGPAAWGWGEDQRWTLARVTTLIGRLFHVRYTLRGTSYLLHRIGFTPQVPVHRAAHSANVPAGRRSFFSARPGCRTGRTCRTTNHHRRNVQCRCDTSLQWRRVLAGPAEDGQSHRAGLR
jgi:hypothetical protein